MSYWYTAPVQFIVGLIKALLTKLYYPKYGRFSFSGTPYPSVPSVEKLFQLLRNGLRMEKPPCCSMDIYLLMRACWGYEPSKRPIFSGLVEELDRILTITANEEYLDLGLPQLDTPTSSEESSCDEDFPFPQWVSIYHGLLSTRILYRGGIEKKKVHDLLDIWNEWLRGIICSSCWLFSMGSF